MLRDCDEQIAGGEVAVHVKELSGVPEMLPADLPPGAQYALDMPIIGGRPVTPRQTSIGKIQSLSPDAAFPARVTIPVYYSLVLGVRDGKLRYASETVSIEGKEPHLMEAIVNSIPPDPETVLRGREWDLVTDGGNGFLKLWVKIDAFRFLEIGSTKRESFIEARGPRPEPANEPALSVK